MDRWKTQTSINTEERLADRLELNRNGWRISTGSYYIKGDEKYLRGQSLWIRWLQELCDLCLNRSGYRLTNGTGACYPHSLWPGFGSLCAYRLLYNAPRNSLSKYISPLPATRHLRKKKVEKHTKKRDTATYFFAFFFLWEHL